MLILQDNSILEIEVAVPERDIVRRADTGETSEQTTERLVPKVIVSSLFYSVLFNVKYDRPQLQS